MDLLQQHPSNREILVELAKLHHLNLRDAANSLTYYERALNLPGDGAALLEALLSAYRDSDARTRGQVFLAQYLRRHPESSLVSAGLIDLYKETQDYDKAESLLVRELDEETARRELAARGDSEDRQAEPQDAAQLDRFIKMKRDLADIYLVTGRVPMAEAIVDELASMAPEHKLLKDWLANKSKTIEAE